MRVLVTGANGFLGVHVAEALAKRGIAVRALVRNEARASARLRRAAAELVAADLLQSSDLAEAFDGVDAVVHLAGVMGGSAGDTYDSFVHGTERLLAAMETSACRRLVLCSSFSVYDYAAAPGMLDETSALHNETMIDACGTYARAKWQQERVARQAAEQHGWDLTVLRPGFIWGAGKAYLPPLGRVLGRHYILIGPDTPLPLTHVLNCADAFATAVIDPRARGETYNVVDGPGVPMRTYLDDYMQGTGKRGTVVPVPYGLAKGLISAGYYTVLRFLPRIPGPLVPRGFDQRLKPLQCDATKLKSQLDWSPPLDYPACLLETYRDSIDPGSLTPRNAVGPSHA